MGQWLTPADQPGELTCFPVFIPAGFEYEAALRGALLLLADLESWEKTGASEPTDVSDAFLAGFFQTVDNWGACNGMVRMVDEVFAYAGQGTPDGCLPCDNAQYLQSEYPALYTAIGNAWGVADSGYFRVPNITARAIIGTGQISGGTLREAGDIGGSESKSITVSNLPEHTHALGISSQNILAGVGNQTAVIRSGGTINTHAAGLGTAFNTMPPFIAIPYFVVAQ